MSSPSKSRLRFQPILPGDTGRLAGVLSGFILLLAVLPILTMIVMSFSGASNLDFPPSSYSLQWYKAAWNTFVSPDASDVLSLGKAMTTSLWVACLTMVLATLVAVPASYALTRCEFRGKGVALQLMSLPLVFPMVVLGLALLLIFDSLPFQMNTSRLVIAHVILALPFVVKNYRGDDVHRQRSRGGRANARCFTVAGHCRCGCTVDEIRDSRRDVAGVYRLVQRVHRDLLPLQH